jgi:tRNA(fMet)-specific endonuclease VapC
VLNILPFGDSDAVKYGQLRADLKRRGELIGPIDMLLAAQALANELIFVTNNTDEFKRVAGLKIEDWSII